MKGLFLLSLLLSAPALYAQPYSIDSFAIDEGGGVSAIGSYSVAGSIAEYDTYPPMVAENYILEGGFGPFFAPQIPVAPVLFIRQDGSGVVLFWLAADSQYLLEHTATLESTNGWNPLLAEPVAVNGFHSFSNSIAPGNDFYRLRRR